MEVDHSREGVRGTPVDTNQDWVSYRARAHRQTDRESCAKGVVTSWGCAKGALGRTANRLMLGTPDVERNKLTFPVLKGLPRSETCIGLFSWSM